MADDLDDDDLQADLSGEVETRPCAFCGASIHPSSHRCPECGGHVGLAWGTVHKEQFLFLFSAVLMAAGCLASWDQVRPSAFDGLQTIRGSMVFAFSVYGIIAGVVALHNRRTLVWPYLLAAAEALWVGIEAITASIGSAKWVDYGNQAGPWFRHLRAIPPGFWLLTMGGALVVIAVLKGIVGGFASDRSKKAAATASGTGSGARRRRHGGATGATTPPAGGPPSSGGIDPATGLPYGSPPPSPPA